MSRMKRSYVISLILILALLFGVGGDLIYYWATRTPQLAFFPLQPGSTWTYMVRSESQHQDYLLTDRVVGERFVEKLHRNCEVVDENYEIDRGGVRPVLYYSNEGFLNRLSGLEYVGKRAQAPTIAQSHRSFAEPEEIVTQAGRFKGCLRIETEARFSGGAYEQPMILNYREWYAPAVGLVKSLATKDGFQGQVLESVELLKFQTPQLSSSAPNASDK